MPEWTLAVPEAAELVVVPWLGAIFATSNGNIIDDFTTTKVIHSKYYEDSREATHPSHLGTSSKTYNVKP